MPEPPTLSVIIPTYNRCESLLRTLSSLNAQTYPPHAFELIIIDDGGNDGAERVAHESFAFPLRYARQDNSGDAAARNRGAEMSRTEFLLFLDDDITLDAFCLAKLVSALAARPQAIVTGNLLTVPSPSAAPSPFHNLLPRIFPAAAPASQEISFLDCLSGFLAVRRADYFQIGMMQSPGRQAYSGQPRSGQPPGGADAWCDVDFAYRAWRQGFAFYRCHEAIAYHHDHAVSSFAAFCRQQEKAGHAGALLLRQYPDLRGLIPMLADKEPVVWKQDPPRLVLHKLFHQITSHNWVVAAMLRLIALLEQTRALPALLLLFYRWVISAHIFRGYRQGVLA